MIHLDHVTLKNGNTPIVTDFSMRVEKGKTLCLCGPSGIGKSSILHMVAGLLPPSCGSCRVGTHKIAYAFQDATLLPWLTVEENICFFAGRGTLCKPIKAARFFLEKTGLSSSASKKPGELSGGMKKRAGLACALACDAELLLLDEPFASLDESWQIRLADLIQQHVDSNQLTLLMVSHEKRPLQKIGVPIKTFPTPANRAFLT
ncbi:MAG: ATP-binding cassette domain-containing protein [Desulfobacterales bacterium]|nr:ATP-binding cassette domain-containing protein [Desulfobacterales bacterium]